MELEKIKLYRMTHIDNIPHILKYGITHRSSVHSNPEFKSIGDVSLIEHRQDKKIVVDNNEYSISDYIPFYFGIRMPMLYVIQHGGNYVPQSIQATNIVYIVVSLSSLLKDTTLSYAFCDGHAMCNMTNFYGSNSIQELPNIIHWEDVRRRQWAGDGVPTSVKQYKQAEFLVRGDIDMCHIYRYICYDDVAKEKLKVYGIEENMISKMPTAYY